MTSLHHYPLRSGTAMLAALVLAVLLGACASSRGPDGPPRNPPAGVASTPNAVPRIEPIRVGGPNKPYAYSGRTYRPLTDDEPLTQSGLGTWYGKAYHGRPTASGEIYDMYAMTAAHPTMPIPSYARVSNPATGRSVIVRVNDRGPFERGTVIDLSYAAAARLGILRGATPVKVERLTFDMIRSGSWKAD
ncbi:MAG: septal ring lytic transglycosylase RlpA family protein [Burkholderiales bacterium]|nr:septal ring lytic transglycosylase RlpA family protein [Burkholderiales bacterium]